MDGLRWWRRRRTAPPAPAVPAPTTPQRLTVNGPGVFRGFIRYANGEQRIDSLNGDFTVTFPAGTRGEIYAYIDGDTWLLLGETT